jgi:hypothetical protein
MKLRVGAQEIDAEKMVFEPVAERWSEYRLDDGTIVRIKIVVQDVFKVPGEDPMTGAPQLVVRSSNVMTVDPPPAKQRVQ